MNYNYGYHVQLVIAICEIEKNREKVIIKICGLKRHRSKTQYSIGKRNADSVSEIRE